MIALGALACPAVAGEPDELHLNMIADGLVRPLYAIAPPGDIGRLFVIEQHDGVSTGWIRIVKDGILLPQPFLAISPVATFYSTGVLCLAFAPDYATSGVFYVLDTDAANTVQIAHYRVSANPDVADAASRDVILSIPQPHDFHQGGWLGFGPDGYLYVSSGDGGPANDPDHRGQDANSLLGKILRVDVRGDDFPADSSRDYAVPAGNPFAGGPGLYEIWALGVREPWRCSFDRLSGDFYLADVGQEQWEEINVQPGGAPGGENYGWRCREASHDLWGDPECAGAAFTEPLLEYPTMNDPRCAIIGGFVYRGFAMPEYTGRYFFADHCTSQIWSVRYEGGVLADLRAHSVIVDDPAGERRSRDLLRRRRLRRAVHHHILRPDVRRDGRNGGRRLQRQRHGGRLRNGVRSRDGHQRQCNAGRVRVPGRCDGQRHRGCDGPAGIAGPLGAVPVAVRLGCERRWVGRRDRPARDPGGLGPVPVGRSGETA
jgi:glucose/arabinose dehydrogenase